jgi:hypothetical protein
VRSVSFTISVVICLSNLFGRARMHTAGALQLFADSHYTMQQ